MRGEILEFAKQMDIVMNQHELEKRDSWKNCPKDFLFTKLNEEVDEWKDTGEKHELIDIANICMMIYNR